MITLTAIALGIAGGALIFAFFALRSANEHLAQARDRLTEVEDKMLVLANRPEAVDAPMRGEGSVSYMDERREAELDATSAS